MSRGSRTRREPVTLDARIRLKRSMDSGEGRVLDPGDKRNKSLPELLSQGDLNTFNKSPHLGSGVYGEARLLSDAEGADVAVAKLTGCGPFLLGNVRQSPFRAEQVEPAMINHLWRHLVETRITPHIIAPFASHAIVAGATSRALKADEELRDSLVFFMERASRNDLRTYLGTIWNAQLFDLHFRVLLFQVCYTLQCIFERWPNFRHNDLKDDNVLLHQARSDGHVRYELSNGRVFCVPRIGVIALLSDFDFSCIAGQMFDNYKVIEQEWDTPSFSISERANQGADIYFLINYVRAQFASIMTPELRGQLDVLYGIYEGGTNSLRSMPHRRVLTVRQLLMESGLFDAFLSPSPAGKERETDESYCCPVQPPAREVGRLSPTFEQRHCPVFRSTKGGATASLTYFSQCPCKDPLLDSEPPLPYDCDRGSHLVSLLRLAYRSMSLSAAQCELCMRKTEARAMTFINEAGVPARWWSAAFTCAFNDVAQDMGLFASDQRCWYISLWTEFWQSQGIVSYTDIQMLHFALQWRWAN